MSRKQIRQDDFLLQLLPSFRVGAPSSLIEAAGALRYAVWINARTDISLRVIGSAYRLEMPDLVDKAFHIIALELQDAAVTKLDALHDDSSNLICIPNIMSDIKKDRSWLNQSTLTVDMLLQQISDRISSVVVSGCLKRIKRWRNDEAGHIVWTSNKFQSVIYEDVVELHEVTCDILRDLMQLVFCVDISKTYEYRSDVAKAMRDQLLHGRLAQD